MKTCSKCKEEKELGEFGKRASEKDGHNYWCKKCVNKRSRNFYKANRKKVLGQGKAWAKKNPEKIAANSRKWRKWNRFARALTTSRHEAKKYGYYPCDATAEELKTAFTGRCFICGVNELDCFKRLALDHDHNRKTKNFRGWLCGKCNSALGLFGDSEDNLIDALHYLMAHQHQEQ